MEAYKKVGRGGAGNFYSKKDIEDVEKSGAKDLESQTPTSPQDLPKSAPQQPPPEYQHSGRGGAGNWYQPAELQSQGLKQDPSPNSTSAETSTIAKGVKVGQSKPAYRGGRGGAGNYVDVQADEKRVEEEEELRRVEMEKRVERDVEAGLARPAKAYGGVGGSFEMK